jgi:hypothetical protein
MRLMGVSLKNRMNETLMKKTGTPKKQGRTISKLGTRKNHRTLTSAPQLKAEEIIILYVCLLFSCTISVTKIYVRLTASMIPETRRNMPTTQSSRTLLRAISMVPMKAKQRPPIIIILALRMSPKREELKAPASWPEYMIDLRRSSCAS